MGFEKIYITNAGAILAAKTLESKVISFTKFALGKGDAPEDVRTATELTSKVIDLDITSITRDTETQVTARCLFRNTDASESFYFKELGLYAKDPDTQEEILFAYGNAGDKAEYITNSISQKIEKYIELAITVDDAENVTITVDPTTVYVTEAQFEEVANTLRLKVESFIEDGQKKLDELLENATPRNLTKTIQAEEWQEYQDSDKTKYKYEVTDEKVTENHLVQCFLDEDEQEKITGRASTKSEKGKYTLILTEKPEEAITMNIVISLTTATATIRARKKVAVNKATGGTTK